MRWADAVGKAVAAALPWPGKHERRAAIDAARQEKERSRARAARSAQVRQEIRQLYQQNQWAYRVADALGVERQERNEGK